MLSVVIFSALSFQSKAQVKIGVNINIGSQPEWGPVGYDHVDYYYLPDIESYYYVPTHQYVYLSGGRWIFAASLPARYASFNVYNSYKVVVNEPKPYLHFSRDRVVYAKYKGGNNRQVIIRDSREDKYREHWHDNGRHEGWNKRDDDRHDNGKHKGWYKH